MHLVTVQLYNLETNNAHVAYGMSNAHAIERRLTVAIEEFADALDVAISTSSKLTSSIVYRPLLSVASREPVFSNL